MEEEFCYWQEAIPDFIQLQYLMKTKKICLLRQAEYRIEKESGKKETTNIFCPYANAEQALECMEYRVSNYEQISKQTN